MKVLKAHEMAEIDRNAIEDIGIPSVVLMENAGRAVFRAVIDRFPDAKRIIALAGKGNNGGDAIVVARLLRLSGREVHLYLVSEDLGGDPALELRIARNVGVKVYTDLPDLSDYDLIIDGLLGTGFKPPVKEPYIELIRRVDASRKPVVAIDLPSGLSADSGKAEEPFIKADLTVTFQFPKICHILFPASKFCGDVIVADISIPQHLAAGIRRETIEPCDLLLPNREPDTHKVKEGHVLLVGGSRGKTGAVIMSALAATSAGAGLVSVGIAEELNPILEASLIEEMTLPLKGANRLSYFAVREILENQERFSALGIGMGMDRFEEGQDIVRDLLKGWKGRILLDADGINNLADLGDLLPLRDREVPAVLTPHIGEFSRLTGIEKEEIIHNQTEVAGEFAQQNRCFLVLKGARTVIAEPDGSVWISLRGTPAMAKGGVGDILSGILTALMGKMEDIGQALRLGVVLHGIAGEIAEERNHTQSIRATDLLNYIGEAYKNIEKSLKMSDTDL